MKSSLFHKKYRSNHCSGGSKRTGGARVAYPTVSPKFQKAKKHENLLKI